MNKIEIGKGYDNFCLQNENDTVMVITLLSQGLSFLAIIFIACEIGNRLTYAFIEVSEEIDRIDYHLLPIEMRKMLPTILIYTRKSVALHGFGSIKYTRETFKKVRSKQME